MSYNANQTCPANDRPLLDAVLPVLAVAGALLVAIWFGAWLLEIGESVKLAASLIVVVLALPVIGIRHAVCSHAATTSRTSPGTTVKQGPAQDMHPPPDPAVAELLQAHGKRWNLDVFANIDAQRFAAVCETWFSWAGFDTRSEALRTSEGVDIWLHAARMPGPVAIVRCKHGHDKPVELHEMREFQGLIANCKSAHGTFTTTTTYTPEALQFAREHGIDAVDGKGLLRKILTRTRQSQQALLAVAYSGR